MHPTPLTDRLASYAEEYTQQRVVPVMFAKGLESDLARATEEIRLLKLLLSGIRVDLDTLRNDAKLWKAGGAGGQDQYAGLPPAMRYLDTLTLGINKALK